MNTPRTVLILGATGHFGGRIARRLAGDPRIRLVLSCRRREAAESFAARLRADGARAELMPTALDQDADAFEPLLAAIKPDIVVHTAGPYQGQDYRVAAACIDCGSHYVDLADGRAFVSGFDTLQDRARAAGLLLVSGASTLPGLSSVVAAAALERFEALSRIQTTIAPAQRTPRGIGTIAAVLSYCGKPVHVYENGRWQPVPGWQDLRRFRYRALGWRLGGVCDVPDLELFPARLTGLESVTFHAALESRVEQLGLWAMAAATRLSLVADWRRHARRLQRLGARFEAGGGDTGGMQMVFDGIGTDGRPLALTWELTARQNHGPEIPCTPALIVVRKLLDGNLDERGAMPCWNLFTLADFDREVQGLDIEWQFDHGQGR